MKINIREHVLDFLRDNGAGEIVERDGRAGILFLDEREFIPFSDLAYNDSLGYFRTSQFPTADRETDNRNPWTLHPVIVPDRDDTWRAFALLDPDGYGTLIGEAWQVADALDALRTFMETGLLSEPVREDDEALGTRWLSTSEAAALAHQYDPERYPNVEHASQAIRQAARRGSLKGFVQTGTNRYKFQERRLRYWLSRGEAVGAGADQGELRN